MVLPLTVLLMLAAAGPCKGGPHACAVAHIERQDFGAAIDTLNAVIARAPRDARALNLLGIALSGHGRLEDANIMFLRALAIDPRLHAVRKNLAINELTRGRLDDAEREFRRVLKALPGDEAVHLHLADIAFARDRLDGARSHYEKSGARVMTYPESMVRYATCLLVVGETSRALTVLEELPHDAAIERFDAGVALGRAGAYANAARFFGSARVGGYADPLAAGSHEVRMLLEAGDYDGAIHVGTELMHRPDAGADIDSLVSRAFAAAGRTREVPERKTPDRARAMEEP